MRGFLTQLALAGACVLVVSCGTDEPAAGTVLPLLSDRSFMLEVRQESGEYLTQRVQVMGDGPGVQLHAAIYDDCEDELLPRYLGDGVVEPEPEDECGVQNTYFQQFSLCLAHRYMGFAEAVAPTDVFINTQTLEPEATFRVRRPGDDTTDPILGERYYTVPVPDASSAASFAIVATYLAQQALAYTALALSPGCPDDSLDVEVGYGTDEVSHLSVVLAIGANEAAQMAMETALAAERHGLAAATERRATDSDEVRARVNEWRARTDSRLEAVGTWLGVPVGQFENPDSEPGALIDAGEGYPVVRRRMATPSLQRAEDLLRTTHVDPRSEEWEEADLVNRLREALVEDSPEIFDEYSMLSDEQFIERMGTNSDDVRLAARSLVEEAAVLGRPIVELEGSFTRVSGTSARGFAPATSYLHAITAGTPDFSEDSPDAHLPPAITYGPIPWDPIPRGVLPTLDFTRGIVHAALIARTDLNESAVNFLDVLEGYIFENIPQRARVCIGNDEGLVQRVRIRLYGIDPTLDEMEAGERYSVWIGEAGRRCGVEGVTEDGDSLVACDRAEFRVATAPTILTGVGASGLGDTAIEWDIYATDVPGYPDGIDPSAHLYVTTLMPALGDTGSSIGSFSIREREILGFGIAPGENEGTWSRCNFFPVGAAVDDVLRRNLAADTSEPAYPANTCAGVPRDIALPLEDEITESGSNSEVVEQVFMHYLQRAEDAAARAENLGERLISEQVEMQNLAEAAVQRLNQICGTNISASFVPAMPPTGCASDVECPPGNRCEAVSILGTSTTRCTGGSLVDYLDGDEADLARLRRCLGDDGGLGVGTLGHTSLCGWFSDDGVLCECPMGEDCSAMRCMQPAGSGETCDERLGGLPSTYRTFESTHMAMTARGGVPRVRPTSCHALAALRERDFGTDEERMQLAQTILDAGWLNQSTLERAANSLVLRREFGGLDMISRGGRPWVGTGTLADGVNTGDFPCAAHSELAVVLEGHEQALSDLVCGGSHPSILCGPDGSCGLPATRRDQGLRLGQALSALALVSGGHPHVPSFQRLETPEAALSQFEAPEWLETALGQDPANILFGRRDVTVGSTTVSASVSCIDTPEEPNFAPEHCDDGDGVVGALWAGSGRVNIDAHSAIAPVQFWRSRSDGHSEMTALVAAVAQRREFPGDRVGYVRVSLEQLPEFAPGGVVPIYREDILDAVELACVSQLDDVGGCAADLTGLTPVRSVEDLARLEQQLHCAADRFAGLAESLAFPDMPVSVADELRTGGLTGSFPRYGGEYAEQLSELRWQFEQIVRAVSAVSSAVAAFAGDIQHARSLERTVSLESEIGDWQQAAATVDRTLGCLAAAMPSVTSGSSGYSVSYNTGSIFVCLNAVAQIAFDAIIADLGNEVENEERARIWLGASSAHHDRTRAIADATSSLAEAFSRVNQTLARMESLRREGRTNIGRMLFLDSDGANRELALHASVRGRMSRTREQYEEAHRNAIRMAFLASRAIEQRLGLDLSTLDRDLTLVDAPARWIDSVCTLNGVDFMDVWTPPDATVPDRDSAPARPRGIRTVADYVARLRLLLDSYLLDYPFVNGTDTVVLSLDDDLLRPRTQCFVAGANLFGDSEDLGNALLDGANWVQRCDGGDTCPGVKPDDREDGPFVTRDSMSPTRLVNRSLGGGSAFQFVIECDPEDDCGGPEGHGGGWGQYVNLAPGVYEVSWHERTSEGGLAVGVDVPEGAPEVTISEFRTITPTDDDWLRSSATDPEPPADSQWQRRAATVTVAAGTPSSEPYLVYFYVADVSDYSGDESIWATIAGPQLEAHGDLAVLPTLYFPTDGTRRAPVGLCADDSGGALRERFTRRCEATCATGIACDEGAVVNRCYYEAQFDISLDAIERGQLIPSGGFAVGNFNYRADSLAVSLVGTSVRDCSTVADSSGCYANGNVPFSLFHSNGFAVRNYLGLEHPVEIMAGAIQSARALAAERYLTNPLSGSDRALLTDYVRTEFRGRPLNGHYIIRIHDTPGLVWENVEDIQVVLNYRYWTRQN